MTTVLKEEKELPVATIAAIEKDHISLIVEIDGQEQTFKFETTPKVEAWVSKVENIPKYSKGKVVEYSAHDGIITIIRPAKTFQKARVEPKPQAPIIDAEKEQKVGLGTVAHTKPVTLAMSEQTVNVTVTGSYDPDKIHGYEVTDTCQVIQFEPITIKVIGDDPETCRRALIEAWGLFGQNNEVTKETVARHIKTHLLKE